MKTIKLNLETYLTYYDKKEVIEVELEDFMVEALEALAEGYDLSDETIEEELPEVYDELESAATSRAWEYLVIDGWKNFRSEVCTEDLGQLYEDSGFDGSYHEWVKMEEAKMSGMTVSEQAEYLSDYYGCECEVVDRCYTYEYIPLTTAVVVDELKVDVPKAWGAVIETESCEESGSKVHISVPDSDLKSIDICFKRLPGDCSEAGEPMISEMVEKTKLELQDAGFEPEISPYHFQRHWARGLKYVNTEGLATCCFFAGVWVWHREESSIYSYMIGVLKIFATAESSDELDYMLTNFENKISYNL